MSGDPLRTALVELAYALSPAEIKLIVGGGYGLLLRTEHILATQQRTRKDVRLVARSTEDLDLFLDAHVITDGELTKTLREAIDRLGYVPIADYFQFAKEIDHWGQTRTVRIDLLASPPPVAMQSQVKVGGNRIRPRTYAGLHAFLTPEALLAGQGLTVIELESDAGPVRVGVLHAFNFLVMKLLALHDRLGTDSEQKYHALDLYRVWQSLTPVEWQSAAELRRALATTPIAPLVVEALEELFVDETSPGALAVREQALKEGARVSVEETREFIADLWVVLVRGEDLR
jgi:hypothetical protein